MAASRVTLLEEAIAEARSARLWYAERNEAAAQAFLVELDHAVDQIGEFPEAWPVHLAGTRRYIFRRFPFSAVYRRHEGAIEVVAIAHHRRRPGYWKDRVKN